ncbi:MAG TPA: formate dehydrogenase accessory protein FdhE [Clostridia bacterium]|nr:formate dehydrogenase accessory protein FdhE [Clostridia bacterium]
MQKQTSTDWTQRTERAIRLRGEHASSEELLSFYLQVLDLQSRIACNAAECSTQFRSEIPLRQQIDIELALPHAGVLFDITERHGPTTLASVAQEMRRRGMGYLRDTLAATVRFSNAEPSALAYGGPEWFFPRVILQPIAENLAQQYPEKLATANRCTLCDSLPQLAVLRPEGDGAKRRLQCSFCLTEWEYRRVVCPWCEETEEDKLPRFSAEEFSHMRVEACDTCKHYLKSVDLSVDGRAVPVVDEVALSALDVWAAEQGYTKITPNLLGF